MPILAPKSLLMIYLYWLSVCLGSAYFAETENFFIENTVDKDKSYCGTYE